MGPAEVYRTTLYDADGLDRVLDAVAVAIADRLHERLRQYLPGADIERLDLSIKR